MYRNQWHTTDSINNCAVQICAIETQDYLKRNGPQAHLVLVVDDDDDDNNNDDDDDYDDE
jgi:hypothetical protein